MSLLNRSPEFNHLYDSEGRLQGGLSALEELAKVITLNSTDPRDHDPMDEANDEIEPARELPVSNPSRDSPSLDSDDDMSDDDDEPGSSDDDAMEEIVMYDEPQQLDLSPSSPAPLLPQAPVVVPSSPSAASLPPPSEIAAQGAALARVSSLGHRSDSEGSTVTSRAHGARKTSRRTTTLDSSSSISLPIGEKLKQRFLSLNVLSTMLVRTRLR